MLRSLWPVTPIVAAIGLAALSLGADQPAAALLFSTFLCALSALILALPGARISPLGVIWLLGGAVLYSIGLLKGWATTGASEYAALMAGAGVFLVARHAALKPERAEILATLVIGLGAALGFAAFLDFFIDPTTLFGLERPYHQTRLAAPFLSANTAATFYGMIALAALAAVLRALKRGGRVDARIQGLALPAASLIICASCLFLSGSRAGISLFMISALALVSWDRAAAWRASLGRTPSQSPHAGKSAIWRALAAPATLVVLGVILFGVSGGLYAERLAQGGVLVGDDARGAMFTRYLEGVWLYPALGSGLGGFEFVNDFLAQTGDARLITGQNAAHNIAFQWILQTGFVGALAALALALAILFRMFKGLARRRSQRLLLRSTLIISVFVFTHGMVDYALEIPAAFWLFALILGLGAGLSDGGNSSRSGPSAPLTLKITACVLLATSSGLSLYAGLDRLSALNLTQLNDAAFSTRFADDTTLTGSAVRLEAIGDRALRLDAPDLAIARAAFRTSLAREPRNAKVWAKAAYVDYAIIPVMAGETEAALRQSYYLMPYADRTFIDWRLDFMANAWNGLPDDLKAAAERESRSLPGRQARLWRQRVGLTEA